MFNFLKPKSKKIGFQLPSNHEFYVAYESKINPSLYLWAKYGCGVSAVNDVRNYKFDELISYIKNNGGKLLGSNTRINKERGADSKNGDEITNFDYYGGPSPNSESMWEFCFNIIWIIEESEGHRVTVYHPVGVKSVHEEISQFVKPRKKSARVGLLLSRGGGLHIESIDCKAPIIDDMDIYYGEGFSKHYERIKELLDSGRPGLITYHGKIGSGKSTLIKYLTSVIEREFIFIPVNMIGRLSDPDFLSLLLYHKGAVLVLEDAEQALQSREKDSFNSSVVATLLNLSDGLLGTLLNVTVIATYNADKQFIDKALLRKGRLLYDHTFRHLTIEESKKLAKHLKKNIVVDKETSIADIFNCEDDTGYVEPEHERDKVMGFGALMGKTAKR